MALATNLQVDPAIAAAFHAADAEAAQTPAYLLVLAIEGTEIKLLHTHKGGADHTTEATFAKVAEETGDGPTARLFLLRQEPHNPVSKWTLISYVPDTVHPKTKMLLAAARDDLKRRLESARFTPDYHVTDVDDLSWAAYSTWRQRDRESAMSEWEKAKERVVAESNAARLTSGSKMAGMAAVPFRVDDAVVAACKRAAPAPPPPAPAASPLPSPGGRAVSAGGTSVASVDGSASAASASVPEGGAEGSGEGLLSPEASSEGGASAGDAAADDAPAASAASPSPAAPLSPASSTGSRSAASAAPPPPPPEFDWVEIAVAGEAILLVGEPRLLGDDAEAHRAAIAAAVTKEGPKAPPKPGHVLSPSGVGAGVKLEPRYFLVRLGYSAVPSALPALLYYCPEGTQPRLRMTYSTAKAALADALAAAGVPLAKQAEARDEEELASALQGMAAAPCASPAAAGGAGGHGHHGRGPSTPGSSSAFLGGMGSPGTAGESSAGGHGRTPSRPGFGGVALPGMGGLPAFGARSPPIGSPGAPGSGLASGEEGGAGFDKPARPGKGPARMIGVAMPGMGGHLPSPK